MHKSIVIGGGLVVVVGLVLWLVWSSSPGPVRGGDHEGLLGGPTVPAEAPGRSGVALTPSSGKSGADVVPPAETAPSAPQRTALAVESVQEDGALELHVLGPEKEPQAGAVVWIVAGASAEEREAAHDLERVDAWMKERGVRRLADGEGKLWLAPPVNEPTYLLAVAGERWGKRTVSPDDEGPLELLLARDVTLRARVVDSTGRPLPGTRVRILHKQSHWSFSVRDADTRGDEAIATFPHAQATVREGTEGTWALAPFALLDPAVEHPLDPAHLTEEIATLVLPAAGAVEVVVRDERGEPYLGEATVSIGLVRDGEPRILSPFSNTQRTRIEKEVENGRARFAFVSPAPEIEVQVRRSGSRVPTRVFGPGPRREGDTASFVVRLGFDHPVIQLRAVDEEGDAIADQKLEVRIDTRHRNNTDTSRQRVETDAEGILYVDLETRWTEGTTRSLVVAKGPRDDPEASGEVDVGRAFAPGLHDLGTVVLGGPPLLVAGRVVTETGEPVGGARLTLSLLAEGARRWRREWNFDAETAPDGSFAIHRRSDGQRVRLEARKPGWAGAPAEGPVGEENLVVELRAEGVIEGTLLLDEGIDPALLGVEALDASAAGDRFRSYGSDTATPSEDGTFRIDALLPGEYMVRVSLSQQGRGLLDVEGVAVRSGETTRDGRLDPCDLRGTLWLHRLTIVPEAEGDPLQGTILFGAAGAERLDGLMWFHETPVEMLTGDAVVDLEVSVPGYRAVRREGVRGEAEIRLRRGLPVRVVLRGDAELPEPPLFIKVALSGEDRRRGAFDFGVPAFDERREVVVDVQESGRLRVSWIVERRSSNGATASSVNLPREQYVEIADVDGEQIVEVTLTREEMEKLVGRLR